MASDVKPETSPKEEVAFKLMSYLIRADDDEIDRVLKLYARCARVVENPNATVQNPMLWQGHTQAH